MKIKPLVNKTTELLSRNSPTILTVVGSVGLITTAVMSGKSTLKAVDILNKHKYPNGGQPIGNTSVMDLPRFIRYIYSKDADKHTKENRTEISKALIKAYLPPIVVGATSIACIMGANSINLKRNAALVSLYSISEATMKEYQQKVVETIGKNKEGKVRSEIAQDTVRNNPVSTKELVITKKGNVLFYDSLSGRYFRSDLEHIKKSINEINRRIIGGDDYASLNQFYYELGLGHIELGESIGWSVDNILDIEFDTTLSEEDEPCIVLSYMDLPDGKWYKR